MGKFSSLEEKLISFGGVIKTKELNNLGFSSRQINGLIEDGIISRIKHGFYESINYPPKEEVIIARLFPKATIFLESAALHYEYTDRIPFSWQIAVDRDSNKNQYDIDYPLIEPYYHKSKFLDIGLTTIEEEGIKIRIYDRERTLCDFLRYEKKLDDEVFTNVIKRYIADPTKNVRRLFEYASEFNIINKVQTFIGVWL